MFFDFLFLEGTPVETRVIDRDPAARTLEGVIPDLDTTNLERTSRLNNSRELRGVNGPALKGLVLSEKLSRRRARIYSLKAEYARCARKDLGEMFRGEGEVDPGGNRKILKDSVEKFLRQSLGNILARLR